MSRKKPPGVKKSQQTTFISRINEIENFALYRVRFLDIMYFALILRNSDAMSKTGFFSLISSLACLIHDSRDFHFQLVSKFVEF